MAKLSGAAQRFMEKRMRAFKEGEMHSGRGRSIVKNRDQAIAIAMNEAREKRYKVPPAV